jgi:hypothetical protein
MKLSAGRCINLVDMLHIGYAGDVGTSPGDSHEAMNFAAVYNTPTIYLYRIISTLSQNPTPNGLRQGQLRNAPPVMTSPVFRWMGRPPVDELFDFS